MKDYILRATAAQGAVRAFVASSKNTVETARKLHNTTPVATAALGRLLTAAAIIGTTLKNEKDLITLQIRCEGEIQGIIATSDSTGKVKGYAFNPECSFSEQYPGKLDVGAAVGAGTLTVIKDIGLKEPYAGQIELISGEIAEDLTYYYAKSEQTPSAIGLGVLIDTDTTVRQAGGFIIQLMPDAPESVVALLEEKIARTPYITDLMDMGKTAEEILDMLLGDMDVVITDKIPMEFYCNCTRERVEKALISIGEKELIKIIEEDKKANLKCHFCNKDYHFNEEDLKKLLAEAIGR
ncbi:MAG TPA: Hsp33 family molecular chaperone HslO [Lachnospiraceae bacterium]|nr:Hsp33 family molecular chaperone HslO [Lachnospiraceae bacterium]